MFGNVSKINLHLQSIWFVARRALHLAERTCLVTTLNRSCDEDQIDWDYHDFRTPLNQAWKK